MADDGKKKVGGKREGAGRPHATKTLQTQMMHAELVRRFAERADEYFQALEDAALGHYVMVNTPDGRTRVYKKSPDLSAIQVALERVFGRPKQTVILTGEEEKINEALDVISNAIGKSVAAIPGEFVDVDAVADADADIRNDSRQDSTEGAGDTPDAVREIVDVRDSNPDARCMSA